MKAGVPRIEPPVRDSLAADRRPRLAGAKTTRAGDRRPRLGGAKTTRAGMVVLGMISALFFATSASAATATVGLGSAASFSVLGGSTVTNTGPTTMFGDLGLSPGSSVTGAPHVLGATHVDDAVAIGAKNALTTAYNDARSRASSGSAGTDLAGQTFLPGVRTASSSLLLSSGSVTLDAQGDPNAVFIFQIGSTLTTGSNTSVNLIGGAQACNVFWQVGSSATLGTGTRFVGTVMAAETITANTAATIHGRLLASTAAVNLDTNTITTSACETGGTETTTPTETKTLTETQTLAETIASATAPSTTSSTAPASTTTGTPTTGTPTSATIPATAALPPVGSRSTVSSRRLAARNAARRAAARRAAARRRRRAAQRHTPARPASPSHHGGFTG